MADPVPTIEPTQFYLGDSLQWDKTLEDYEGSPADPAFVLTYKLIPQTSGTTRTIIADFTEGVHQVRETAATTAGWTAGDYWLVGYVTGSDLSRFQVYTGPVTVLADPSSATSYDGRTYLERILDLLETSIEANEAPRNVIRYSYGGVVSEVRTLTDALKARDQIKAQIRAEAAAAAGVNRRVVTRFTRPR